ncbi:MAG TPA: hypothetical protein VJT78_14895, partial [Candidatus Dormibacteraeota bacterium]|nr:hypothetical protein [Candidatus Dormibacteraeota bacterium]
APAAAEVAAPAAAAAANYLVHVTLEPEPGTTGDPSVLEVLRRQGYGVAQVDGTGQMRISVPRVSGSSSDDAARRGLETLGKLVPAKGYRLSAPQAVALELEKVGR